MNHADEEAYAGHVCRTSGNCGRSADPSGLRHDADPLYSVGFMLATASSILRVSAFGHGVKTEDSPGPTCRL